MYLISVLKFEDENQCFSMTIEGKHTGWVDIYRPVLKYFGIFCIPSLELIIHKSGNIESRFSTNGAAYISDFLLPLEKILE